jgi:hypothetical protein
MHRLSPAQVARGRKRPDRPALAHATIAIVHPRNPHEIQSHLDALTRVADRAASFAQFRRRDSIFPAAHARDLRERNIVERRTI